MKKLILMENKDQRSDEKIKEIIRKLDWKAFWIGLIGVAVLIAFPVWIADHFWFDYSKTGTFGDTIGGITAPIIGLISALLIYLSFRAQIKANYIVQSQIDRQRLEETEKREYNYQMEIINHVKEMIDNYDKIYKRFNDSDLKGPIALSIILKSLINKKEHDHVDENLLKSLYKILYPIDSVIKSFKNAEFNNLDIRLPVEIICFIFETHIIGEIREHISDALSKDTLVPDNVYNLYKFIDVLDKELDHLYMAQQLSHETFSFIRK